MMSLPLADGVKLAAAGIAAIGYGACKLGLVGRNSRPQAGMPVRYPARRVLTPRQIVFERALLDICPVDHLDLIRLTAKLKKMGFSIVGDFGIDARGEIFARAFSHRSEPLYAIWTQRVGRSCTPPYLDFLTLLADQSFLLTSNSAESVDPRRPAVVRLHLVPGHLPEELYQRHMTNLQGIKTNAVRTVPVARDSFLEHYRELLVVDACLRPGKRRANLQHLLKKTFAALPPIRISPILERFDGPEDSRPAGVPTRDPLLEEFGEFKVIPASPVPASPVEPKPKVP